MQDLMGQLGEVVHIRCLAKDGYGSSGVVGMMALCLIGGSNDVVDDSEIAYLKPR
jgi:hypothetical protein